MGHSVRDTRPPISYTSYIVIKIITPILTMSRCPALAFCAAICVYSIFGVLVELVIGTPGH